MNKFEQGQILKDYELCPYFLSEFRIFLSDCTEGSLKCMWILFEYALFLLDVLYLSSPSSCLPHNNNANPTRKLNPFMRVP